MTHVLRSSKLPHLYLWDHLPKDVSSAFDFGKYYEHEKTVLEPAMTKIGMIKTGNWYSTEYDSFGPLTRGVIVTYQGVEHLAWYG